MKTPILIFEGRDVGIYNSVEQAEKHLELVDVKDGIYDAYDYNGFLLDVTARRVEIEQRFLGIYWRRDKEIILIQNHEPESNCSNKARERLLEYLLFKKYKKKDIENLSLQDLIALVSRYMPWAVNLSGSE